MINADFGLQIPGKPAGDLPRDPILSGRRFNENPGRQDKEGDGYKEPEQYFLKSLQSQ